MKCPNCGALIDNEKTKCFLCGANIQNNTSTSETPETHNYFQIDPNGFSTGQEANEEFIERKNEYISQFPEYNNQKSNYVQADKKDVFDFYGEHKKGILIIILLLSFALAGFIGYKIYDSYKNPKLKPILQNLYYEIDEQFNTTKDNANEKTYTISSNKGNDCSISVSYGTTTSKDHVLEYYENISKALEPEKDKAGNIINAMQLYKADDKEQIIHGNTWYYRSIYYKTSIDAPNYTELKYRYYTSVHKGYYYDIVLVNNNNSNTCSIALDAFTNSLQFIE